MTARRMPSSRPGQGRPASAGWRSSQGSTRSLQTMVETAIASTMIMPVAADSPPTKAASASHCAPADSGSESTNISASAPPGPKCTMPASAIGSTNRLMANR